MKEGYGPASVAVVSIDARLRRVADLDRNTRPLSTGTGGRNEPESVADLKRNQWPNWAGICTLRTEAVWGTMLQDPDDERGVWRPWGVLRVVGF